MKSVYNLLIIMFLTSMIIWSSGCQKFPFLEGNGNVVSETRPSVSFNKIENKGDFKVYYVFDTVFRVVVEAESNLIPYIRTNVHGNTLEIDSRENLDNNYSIKITVYSPVLVGVALTGSGLINIDHVVSNNFDVILTGSGVIYGDVNSVVFNSTLSGSGEIDFAMTSDYANATISGSGRIKLSGDCIYADYKISGSGNIESYDLPVFECIAKISGSGNIYTRVSDRLNVNITGSGNLYYIGNPYINSNITGSGQIIGG
jgi:putative autotransporter adhesin-like protein